VSLYEYSSILVNAGYRTVVVEQVERVGEMNKGQGRKSDAVVKREACQAHSAGTLTHEVMLKKSPSPAQPNYLMALWFGDASAHPGSLGERLSFGCCVVDCTTSTFKYGWFEDKPDRQLLRTILITLQPRELLADKKSIPTAVHRLVQSLAVPPTVTQWQHWDPGTGLSSKHGNEDEPLPVQRACGAVLAYLRQAMLYEAVTSFATWERLSTSDASSTGLILDANALEQLEVLRNTDGKLEGSLLEHLDHTVTPFGKRMLRQWVCCPMRRKVDIDRRLDVVDWLLERGELVSELRSKMGKLPDIERRQNRVFALGLQMERKAVLYGEVESSRIAQFMELLAALKEADDCLAKVRDGGDKLPALLNGLVPVGELGHVDGILDELGSRVQGSEVTGYSPSPGCYPAYDEARSKIASIKSDLQEELKKICNEHLKGCKMQEAKFVSVKYRYEIEVPERCAPRNLEEHGLEVSSTRKGFVRLLSQEIREMTDELEKTEEQMKDCLYPFMAQLFKDFHKHTVRLQDMVQRLATLDCLLSLSEASRPGSGPMCRPEILDSADFPVPILDLQDGRHPVQEAVLARSGREFVANTVEMGVHASPTTLLVTGPNMGGKSCPYRIMSI
ncbi:DNA mismatch repair protein msh6, partial [Perkinsus olseni]